MYSAHTVGATSESDRDDDAAPKRYVVPMLLAFVGLGLGLSHVYVGKPAIGFSLLAFAAAGLATGLSGYVIGYLVVAVVWSVDLVGGLMGVARHNQRLGHPQ